MTINKLLLTAAVAAALFTAGGALAQTNFLPGLWETKTRSAGENDTETTRDCVTPDEAKRETLEKRLAEVTQDQNCKYAQRSIGGGKFALAGTCNNDGIKSSVKQTGTYSPTAMTMNMSMTLATPGSKPVSMNIIITSRRIAATCPADMND